MDSSLTFYLVLGALLLGFIVLGMLKGMIKMLLFGAAVLSSVAAYFWLSKYGFTYLSFITSDPREWMVTVLSVGGAAAGFFCFFGGCSLSLCTVSSGSATSSPGDGAWASAGPRESSRRY